MNHKHKDTNKLFELADKIKTRMSEKNNKELEKNLPEETKAVRVL
jgi:hypothetical protein